MNEKPIVMGAESVRAILAGRKTVTRRIMKDPLPFERMDGSGLSAFTPKGFNSYRGWTAGGDYLESFRRPYAWAGQRLWVREGWAIGVYRADVSLSAQSFVPPGGRWRSPIFMPRGFSRIDLEVVSVRAERLQEITEEDAEREGVERFHDRFPNFSLEQTLTTGEVAADSPYRSGYAVAWDELNADKATWKSNPWVWRIEFRVIEIRS